MTRTDAPALLETLLARPARIDRHVLAEADPDALLRAADDHHVIALVSAALDAIDASTRVARTFHAAAGAWALRERAESDAIRAFLDAARGLPLLFFKGASTAYTLYRTPALRMREDWDVLAAPGAEEAAAGALESAGFVRDRALKPGDVRVRQQSFRRPVPGSECIVDLHQQTLNPPSLSNRIRYADLDACTVPLPSLHPDARGLADEAALVVACAHRLAHHSGEPRLSWDYDVLLLARRLDAASIARVEALADRWSLGVFVATELERVTARFGETLPPPAAERVSAMGAGPGDPYARANRSRAREFLLDWRELGWRQRIALVRETIVPDPSFVRATRTSRLPLPLLYVARIVRGARGWFTRS